VYIVTKERSSRLRLKKRKRCDTKDESQTTKESLPLTKPTLIFVGPSAGSNGRILVARTREIADI